MATLPEFPAVPVPQDMTISLPGGQCSPAWYHYFLNLQRLMPKITSQGSALNDDIDARDTATNARVDASNERITTLEGHFGQAAVADAVDTTLTFDPTTYTAAEIVALDAKLSAVIGVLNALLASARASTIIED
jgi:hypothetical protein